MAAWKEMVALRAIRISFLQTSSEIISQPSRKRTLNDFTASVTKRGKRDGLKAGKRWITTCVAVLHSVQERFLFGFGTTKGKESNENDEAYAMWRKERG